VKLFLLRRALLRLVLIVARVFVVAASGLIAAGHLAGFPGGPGACAAACGRLVSVGIMVRRFEGWVLGVCFGLGGWGVRWKCGF
jgi:hypothetical protein